MEKKQRVLELRERLDETLALPDLANEELIKSLVKNQLLRSSFSGMKGWDFIQCTFELQPVVIEFAIIML